MRPQLALMLLPALAGAPAPGQEWPQFGGPTRDFKASASGLAQTWPAGGPKRLWSRDLGDGYSAIAAHSGRLYTLYRPVQGALASLLSRVSGSEQDLEVVIALDARSGRTLWEHAYAAPLVDDMNMEYGPGPHSTPLVIGGSVFAVGATGLLHALDQASGRVLWSRELWGGLGGSVMNRGYSCSPIAWKDTLMLTLGGPGQALVAFDRRTGAIAWKGGRFDPSPSSPLLIEVDGQSQLVVFHSEGVAGLDPDSGAELWNHPHRTDWGLNISMPVWGEDNVLFISSAYSGGSRALRLSQSEGSTEVEELWFNNKMRIHFGNAIRLGDHVYGSSGDFGPAFLAAIDVRSGRLAWQERGLARATAVYADGRLVLLDEDGVLALASVSPSGLEIHAKAEALDGRAWTAPTLAGTTLYVRDRDSIAAFDLR